MMFTAGTESARAHFVPAPKRYPVREIFASFLWENFPFLATGDLVAPPPTRGFAPTFPQLTDNLSLNYIVSYISEIIFLFAFR